MRIPLASLNYSPEFVAHREVCLENRRLCGYRGLATRAPLASEEARGVGVSVVPDLRRAHARDDRVECGIRQGWCLHSRDSRSTPAWPTSSDPREYERMRSEPVRVETKEPPASEEAQGLLLGYLDSNQEQLNQNQPCCQLHHTPMAFSEDRAGSNSIPGCRESTNRENSGVSRWGVGPGDLFGQNGGGVTWIRRAGSVV